MYDTPVVTASVVVCTYNRAASLRHTLEALHAQRVPADLSWELIVVDNNSQDGTRQVVEEYQARMPYLRYEFEGRQGLSHARNHGLSCARGGTVLFTDDDVRPEPDWVMQILKGLDEQQADACGGYIAPIWETPPPAWLTARFHGFLAIKMLDGPARPIKDSSELPYGANMAFRRALFDRVGVFDTQRGRTGNVLASGEDGELFERILASGAKVVYLPEARVNHCVESFRLNKRYFRRWRFQNSRNLGQTRGLPGRRRLFNVPVYIYPQALKACARALYGYLAKAPDEAFHREIIVWHFLGIMAAAMRQPSGNRSGSGP